MKYSRPNLRLRSLRMIGCMIRIILDLFRLDCKANDCPLSMHNPVRSKDGRMILILFCRDRPSVENLRTVFPPIAVRKIGKSPTSFFSLWRESFLVPEPKQKSLRTTFYGVACKEILARRPSRHEMRLYALEGGRESGGRNLFADLLVCSLYLCATGE